MVFLEYLLGFKFRFLYSYVDFIFLGSFAETNFSSLFFCCKYFFLVFIFIFKFIFFDNF